MAGNERAERPNKEGRIEIKTLGWSPREYGFVICSRKKEGRLEIYELLDKQTAKWLDNPHEQPLVRSYPCNLLKKRPQTNNQRHERGIMGTKYQAGR